MATAPNAARAPAARAPRSSRVYVRLTVKERANLDDIAHRTLRTPSDVVRDALAGRLAASDARSRREAARRRVSK